MAQLAHTYPSDYPPGTHKDLDTAWSILDTLAPGVLSDTTRVLLAGMIISALAKARKEGARSRDDGPSHEEDS